MGYSKEELEELAKQQNMHQAIHLVGIPHARQVTGRSGL